MLYLCNNCIWTILLNSIKKGNIIGSILKLLLIFHVYINCMLSLVMSSPQHEGHILGFLNYNVRSQLDKCKMKHKYLLICWKYGVLIRHLVFLDSEADIYPAKGMFRDRNGLTIKACDDARRYKGVAWRGV